MITLTGKEDESVVFECEISKEQYKKTRKDIAVKWFKDGREIKDISKYLIKKEGVKHSLTIQELEFSDIADYSAVVVEEKTTAKLEFQEKDVEITSGLKDVVINENETAQFDFEANKLQSQSGEAYPIVWYRRLEGKKEEKIEIANRFEVLTKNRKTILRFEVLTKNRKTILRINQATLEDSGAYSVIIGEHK